MVEPTIGQGHLWDSHTTLPQNNKVFRAAGLGDEHSCDAGTVGYELVQLIWRTIPISSVSTIKRSYRFRYSALHKLNCQASGGAG